jgi:uncharacterized protein (TIGR02145 family)
MISLDLKSQNITNIRIQTVENKFRFIFDIESKSNKELPVAILLKGEKEFYPKHIWGDIFTAPGKDKVIYWDIISDTSSLNGVYSIEIYSPLKLPSCTIEGETWSASNIQVTHFRNGDQISSAKNAKEWRYFSKQKIPGYFKLNDNILYNWYAVDDPRGLSPPGWHIPSSSDWAGLYNNLLGEKSKNFDCKFDDFFNSNSNYSISQDGRLYEGWGSYPNYNLIKENIVRTANWWSANEANEYLSWHTDYWVNDSERGSDGFPKGYGLPVRCIKNRND